MIDTNTVNFAIGKLSEAFTAVAPTLKNVSQQYVEYLVYKVNVYFWWSLAVIFVGLLMVAAGIIYGFIRDEYDHPLSITAHLLGGLCVIVGIGLTVDNGSQMMFANKFPQMYTINKIIEATK